MQGHSSAMGPSPGTIDFDHSAAPSNAVINTDIFWNDRLLPDLLPTSGSTAVTHFNTAGIEQNLSLWGQGEASSSNLQNAAGRSGEKLEEGWASSGVINSSSVPEFEEWFNTPAYLSPDNGSSHHGGHNPVNRSLCLQSSSITANHHNAQASGVGTSPQNLNMNVRVSGESSDRIQSEPHNLLRSGFSEGVQIMPAGVASHSFVAPGNGDHLMGDYSQNFGNTHDTSRLSCKRKFVDEDMGQSSASGSSRSYLPAEGSFWRPIPVDNSESSSNMSFIPENSVESGTSGQLQPVLGPSPRSSASENYPDANQVDNARHNSRNLRFRLSSSVQPSPPLNIGSTGSAFTPSNDSELQHPNATIPPPLRLPLPAVTASSNQQTHPAAAHSFQTAHSFRRSRGSSSRSVASSGITIGERTDAELAETALRMSRQLLERHMRAQQLVQVARSRNLSLLRGSVHVPSSSIPDSTPTPVSVPNPGSEPNANANTSFAPTWTGGHSYASGQRIAELIRRSMSAATVADHASSSNSQSTPVSGAAASRQSVPLSGMNIQGNQQAHRRLALLMQRRANSIPGIPYSMPSLGASGDDRSRIISEIWGALGSMRRGEPLRAEDMMILNQSGLLGMAAELHDRHRDMRLDVDNMTYEELLALEERIGNVSTGLSEEAIIERLKQHKHVPLTTTSEVETEPCSICQEEYNEGEDLGTLECGHNFHTVCVKQWLILKNLCPICKTTGLTSK